MYQYNTGSASRSRAIDHVCWICFLDCVRCDFHTSRQNPFFHTITITWSCTRCLLCLLIPKTTPASEWPQTFRGEASLVRVPNPFAFESQAGTLSRPALLTSEALILHIFFPTFHTSSKTIITILCSTCSLCTV